MKPEQITAWALDEASAEERERLEAELRDNPKAKQAADETKDFCHFLLAELRDDSLALTDEQREKLKTQLVGQSSRLPETEMPPQWSTRSQTGQTKWRTGVIVRLALAACVTLGAVWTWQIQSAKSNQRATLAVKSDSESEFRIQNPSWATQKEQVVMRALPREASGLSGAPGGLPGVAGMPASLSPGLPGAPVTAEPAPATPRLLAGKPSTSVMTRGDVEELRKMQDQTAYGIEFEKSMSKDFASRDAKPANPQPAAGPAGLSGAVAGSNTLTKTGAGTLTLSGANTYSGSTSINAGTLTVGTTVSGTEIPAGSTSTALTVVAGGIVTTSPPADAFYFATANGRSTVTTDREQESVRAGWATQMDARSNNESYTRIIENDLKDVAREPLSTFSIDVDTAAYANVRRFLNQNMIPPPDAVRIEELVNYFPTAEEGPAHDAKEPFGVRVELAPCPWQPVHRLARIAIKGRELGNERKASNLVFLVDVSGSMNEPNKLPLVQQSLRMLTEQLGEEDRVTMVVYAGSSGLVLPPTNGENKTEILAAINKLQAGGSTHGSAGIQLAYEQAVAGFIKGGVNRVILCTDGDFNVGVSSPEELEKLITRKAKSGVFLSVLGFGSGNLKDRTMETLADKGNGNYAYIDSLSEARKVLVEQMSGTLVTIAKDVKIQVEFNPAAVRSYRLIGYENRLLAKEDFNDDTKDAGEIGAGHSVVALYEVVPANLPPGADPRPAVDSLKYQTPTIAPAQLADAAKSGEMMTVKLRYKAPDSDLSKLIEMPVKDEGKTLTASSEEYKFSAAVAGFGLLLRDSGYKGTLSWETVRKLAIDGKGADKLGYRGEFLQLIDKARGLKETRP